MKLLIAVIYCSVLVCLAMGQATPDLGIPDDSNLILTFGNAQGVKLIAVTPGQSPRFELLDMNAALQALKLCSASSQAVSEPICNQKFLTAASLRSVLTTLFEGNQKLLKENSALTDDYNLLAGRYNRLAAVSSVELATPRQSVVRDRNATVLAIWQALNTNRQPPTMNLNIQVSDCTRLPALCVH